MELRYDIIVAGGGPAGVAAGIAAARNGAKVLLLEKHGFLGGMATAASVPAFCPFSDGEKAVIQGIGLEVLERMKGAQNWQDPFRDRQESVKWEYDWVPIDPEVLKRVLDEMVVASGCGILLHAAVSDLQVEDGAVKAVVVADPWSNRTIRCRYLIDCTGDADLVVKAGGECEYGDERGLVQAVTLCFRLANINLERFMAYARENGENGNLAKAVARAKADGEFPFDEKHVCGFAIQNQGMAGLNFGHVYEIHPLQAEDLTRAEIESRKRLPAMLTFLKKYVPGLEDAVLASSGPALGVRETRRIVGEYRLTKQDYYDRRVFEDTIARYAYPLDVHAATPGEVVYQNDRDEYISSKYRAGESYGIPYRALLPKGLKNVIVAGRPLAADRAMHGSFRVMPACFATGQAAGTAAAICAGEALELRAIDIPRLQKRLKAQGAYLG